MVIEHKYINCKHVLLRTPSYDKGDNLLVSYARWKGIMLICEGIFFLLGLFILITGKFKITGGRTVIGPRARVAGFILLLPGPLALSLGLIVGATAPNLAQWQQTVANLSIVEFFFIVGALLLAVIIGITAPTNETISRDLQFMPDILTVSEAARYVRATETDILQMIVSGQLKAVKIGGDYRISKEVLNTIFKPQEPS